MSVAVRGALSRNVYLAKARNVVPSPFASANSTWMSATTATSTMEQYNERQEM